MALKDINNLTLGHDEKELKKVFDKYKNKKHWKNSFSTTISDSKVAQLLIDAIIYYHGTYPKVETIPTYLRHKKGLVIFQGKNKFKISSPGYSAY